MNKRDRVINKISWISFIGGMSSFVFKFFEKYFILHYIFLFVSIITIVLGICGIYGKAKKYIRLRSLVGFMLGHLYFGLFCFIIIISIE